jgi:hypothetical protein
MNNKQRLYNLQKLYEIENKDDAFIKEVVSLFLNTVPPVSKALVKAAAEKKWEDVYFLAHKMKANIDLLNIQSIQKEIRIVEENARAKESLDHMAEKVKFINSIIQRCAIEIRDDFDGSKTTPEKVNS